MQNLTWSCHRVQTNCVLVKAVFLFKPSFVHYILHLLCMAYFSTLAVLFSYYFLDCAYFCFCVCYSVATNKDLYRSLCRLSLCYSKLNIVFD